MKVFISWSGTRSKKLAEVLSSWLPFVVQTVEPWISHGIPPGKKWQEVLAKELADTNVGIFCITPDNVDSQWLHYEAGALSKDPDPNKALVIPLLFGVTAEQLRPPLAQFQGKEFREADLLDLVTFLAKASGANSAVMDVMPHVFKTFWEKLENDINEIIQAHADATAALWEPFLNSPIEIIYSVDKGSNALISANTYQMEFQAMVEIFPFLISRAGDKLDISARPSNSSNGSRKIEAQILIGGPNRNTIVEQMLAHIPKVRFRDKPDELSGHQTFRKSWVKVNNVKRTVQYGADIEPGNPNIGKIVQKDYGISARVRVNNIETLILAGCHSYGAHAAAIGMTSDHLINEVYTRIKKLAVKAPIHFIALWETNIVSGAVQTPKLIDAVLASADA